jgi:hypothetical protein
MIVVKMTLAIDRARSLGGGRQGGAPYMPFSERHFIGGTGKEKNGLGLGVTH